jgi:hypothetical protein
VLRDDQKQKSNGKWKMKTKYKKPDWAVDQTIRLSGLVEDICVHGVGHPNLEWLKEHDPDDKLCLSVHGCDGCCTNSFLKNKK